MYPEENDFRDLRRLLALKRHEQPPPGYFHKFSGNVIARIKAGEAGREENIFERWLAESSWFGRIWAAIQGQPALAGAMGLVTCGVLLGGLLLADPAQGSGGIAAGLNTMSIRDESAHAGSYSRTNGLMTRQLHQPLFKEAHQSEAQLVNYLAPAGL